MLGAGVWFHRGGRRKFLAPHLEYVGRRRFFPNFLSAGRRRADEERSSGEPRPKQATARRARLQLLAGMSIPIDYDSVADIYDLYVTTSYDIPFFLEEAAKAQGPVLEIAAGTGRVSLPLIQAGVQLTSVDRSAGMLNVLSRKLTGHNLKAEIRCADVCELEPCGSFHLALLPSQSFMEIIESERQQKALSAVFGCLRPGGRFICTLHNPTVRRRQVDGNLRIAGAFPIHGGTLLVSGFEQGGNPVVAREQFFEFFASDGQLLSKQLLRMQFALIEKEDFEAMARHAGFHVQEMYGDYDRSPFDAASSPLMIWILQK